MSFKKIVQQPIPILLKKLNLPHWIIYLLDLFKQDKMAFFYLAKGEKDNYLIFMFLTKIKYFFQRKEPFILIKELLIDYT